MIIDATTGGVLMSKNLEEARELLHEMSSNHHQWQSLRRTSKKIARVYELDTLSAIQAQLAVITKWLGTTTISFIQTNSFCDFCRGDMKAILATLIVLPSNKQRK